MRIIKPQHLSILPRTFERQQRAYLCVSVIAFCPLLGEAALLPEQELWPTVTPLLGDTPLDMGLPKTGGEYIVAANAMAPGGAAVTQLKVGAKVGALQKILQVHGAREWRGRQISAPAPFKQMPLNWQQAYGGAEFTDNPFGTGAPLKNASGDIPLPLPCVEYPHDPATAPGKAITPASFFALHPMSTQRKRFDGTYDSAWLKQDYPGPPKDFDWRYHCIASADQWQAEPFKGDEVVELVHMHGEHARISGRLPGITPVIGVRLDRMADNAMRFIEPKLTTVWLFPNQLRMALVWHSLLQVGDEFGDDVQLVMAAAEWTGKPRGKDHYLKAVAERQDKERGAIKMLDDHELLPEGLATPNDSAKRHLGLMGMSDQVRDAIAGKLAENKQSLNAKLATVPKSTDPSAAAANPLAQFNLPVSMGDTLPASTQEFLDLARKVEPVLAQMAKQLTAQDKPATVKAAKKPARDAAPSLTAVPLAPGQELPQAALARVQQIQPQADAAMLGIAHLSEAPPAIDAATAEQWRTSAQKAKEQGRSFAGLKLQGADFSGMDLSGVDFTGAELESTNFANATLQGATFERCPLAFANFSGAKLKGASFAGSNLGKAAFAKADAESCNFQGATLSNTQLNGAQLAGCNFRGATLLETNLEQARLNGAVLSGCIVLRSKLRGADMSQADITKASFVESDLQGAAFRRAVLTSADFVTCMLDGAVFDEASADNARFVHGSSLKAASFAGASLRKACLRNMPLVQSNFERAQMDQADLSHAQCGKARLFKASLKNALLLKCDLQAAVLQSANLMQAVMQHADLRGADLRGTNLFACDMARIETDAQTRTDQAFTAKVRTVPARKVLAPST
jgi:uncharacterized protein YjbI with pentapeptide repeats